MNSQQTENPSLAQSRRVLQEIQSLLEANLKMRLADDLAWEFTAASLMGCLLELKSKVPTRRRLHDFKEAIERAQKDGVGMVNKRI
jgi:hypothetical protein